MNEEKTCIMNHGAILPYCGVLFQLCPGKLKKITMECFDEGMWPDGRRYLVPIVSVVKSTQPELTEMDLKLFSQQILLARELVAIFCAGVAYDAMEDLLGVVLVKPGYLF